VSDDLRQPADSGGNDRYAVGEGLERDVRETLHEINVGRPSMAKELRDGAWVAASHGAEKRR